MMPWLDENDRPITMGECLIWFDGPQVFEASSASGLYLGCGTKVNLGETHCDYLLVPISPQRMDAVRASAIDLYEAFRGSEHGYVIHIACERFTFIPTSRVIAVGDLDDDWIPDPGTTLDMFPRDDH